MSRIGELSSKIEELLFWFFHGERKTHSEVRDKAEQLMPICGVAKGDADYDVILNRAVETYEMEVGIKSYDPIVIAKDKKSNLWLYQRKDTIPHAFFKRYKMHLKEEGFAQTAISNIERTCEEILSYCADPLIGHEERKKGLVVGDVQSGKTANYLALINMAYDYGYKIVVLLAGLTDSLRLQTQKRTDAGVIGAISDTIGNQIVYCGVGETNKDHFAIPFTNRENDFAKFIQKNLNATINDFRKPVVLVVKKNKKILESVMERLRPALSQYGSNSLLIIDDEADNASVNTSKPGKDPTAINRCIKGIFNSFPIASYVGFTATPFANIFINPEDDPANKDLFPSDFIVQLTAPDNYFGGRKVFAGEELARPIRLICEDEVGALPVVHHKDDPYFGLTDSLKEAILSFLINNVVRTLRGHGKKHRSMMINISRFNNMHRQIRDSVASYVESLKNIIEQDSGYPLERFIKNEEMRKLYELFEYNDFYQAVKMGDSEKEYAPISWAQIQSGLYDEIKQFNTVIVNSKYGKGERFDYEDYEDTGARVISIGGFVLSRGLTLEGLMVSYYSRNAGAYDTLLQMCRWFGYRPKYDDLCRVYLSQINVDCFNAVLDAVEDLREQFAEMKRQDKKPSDFGLMVRESPETLETTMLITARSKLQHTDEIVYHLNYGGVYPDTSKLSKDPEVNKHNHKEFDKLYNKLSFDMVKNRYMARGVSKYDIADFIRELKIPYVNRKFDTQGLSEYIENSDIFHLWDVVIATGESNVKFKDRPAAERSFHVSDNETFIRIGAGNNRVLDPGILDSGLTDSEKEEVIARKAAVPGKKNPSLTAIDYLKIREYPILVIYPLDLITGEDAAKIAIKDNYGDKPLLAFAVAFPEKESSVKFKYRINKVKMDELNREMEVDEEEEDDDDND